jgi:hypothetical protein
VSERPPRFDCPAAAKAARRSGNSVFIDERFHAYKDQWEFLAQTRRLSEEEIGALISKLCPGSVLGVLRQDDEEPTKPWETRQSKLWQHEFPNVMEVVKANMLYISKSGASSRALNALKRLAAFKISSVLPSTGYAPVYLRKTANHFVCRGNNGISLPA